MTQKIITFGIPCYNSADYMDHCPAVLLDPLSLAEIYHANVQERSLTFNNGQETVVFER